jgi:hypothetical protein
VADSNLWIPVIGTLGGALLGFAASSFTVWWNAAKADQKSLQDRNRNNLEELFRTFIILRTDGYSSVSKCLNKIYHNIAYVEKIYPDIPPNSKAEMLIKLYAPELKESWENYVKSKDDFAGICVKILLKQCDAILDQEKKEIEDQLLERQKAFNYSIYSIHLKISEVIER